MFMAARVNRLGVMNELEISFHVLPSRADILCVEVFCSQYLFKTFSDTRLRCVSHQLHQQPNGPVFKGPCPQPVLLAPGRVRQASARIRLTLPGSVDSNHGLEELQIDKLLGIRG